eukprot:TRINITY_DN8046_c0_g1_i2.p2 TRINITY_DN8046_c0_g1~~TRINITY_DN8046_c0_g1_i2.p2  ORF type:complete len:311 (-),score=50.72 TRINITY_DN8046_c0_g1_i2:508-1440(-)
MEEFGPALFSQIHIICLSIICKHVRVMIYVSFTEIFMIKGVAGFEDAGNEDGWVLRYATFSFFGGMLLVWCLDVVVHNIVSCAENRHHHNTPSRSKDLQMVAADSVQEFTVPKVEKKKEDMESGQQLAIHEDTNKHYVQNGAQNCSTIVPIVIQDNDMCLKKMGLLTALAIFIHNLPEGLATFVAALSSPVSGIAIAFAIAIHNIPEGICVAMPVYYATGSRWKGLLWAFLSGLSEPIGGLLAYLALYGDNMSHLAYGILFSMVAGMMVYISIHELIPTALKYDPSDMYTTRFVFVGMLVMAASLLLFTI